ncbi:MAG TPA: DUF1540 domain-containing protein [Clostridiales bacterium]|nr:DUF1540 domain-containing protein [Clostridiales bacterium]
MEAKKMEHPNDGVKCIVNTCEYYMSGDHCAAEKIEVHPKNATGSNETDCVTFKPSDKTY